MGRPARALRSRPGPAEADRTVILGISCDYHDSAAALIRGGEVLAAVEEERLTRIKHDASLPARSVASCLKIAGIEAGDVDLVAFYEKPLSLVGRYLASRQRRGPAGMRSFVEDAPKLLGANLMVGYRLDRLLRDLGATRSPQITYVEHHRSHAAAAFFPSPFAEAAVLTVDGIGEWATATIGHGAGRRVDLLEEMRYPDSLGLLYSFFTSYCGFDPNDGEFKVMGLAPYGTPRFVEQLSELARVHLDGSVRVDARQLGWYSRSAAGRGRLVSAFGPARRDGEPLEQRHADLAASVQAVTESAVLRMAAHAQDLTGSDRLCLAGGVALNCVANGRLLREGPFAELWIQPAAGDAGSAIGAALSIWHEQLEQPRTASPVDAMSGSLLGPKAGRDEVLSWLEEQDLEHRWIEDPDELATEVAGRLASGEIIGWYAGRMEFGPRALGSRSILADSRDPDVRRRLNRSVKQREDFRPFAPAVLREHAAEWFELDVESPYMLLVAQVRAAHLCEVEVEPSTLEERSEIVRSDIPACTHVDGSARVQTVDSDRSPDFYRLLTAFYGLTGCPVLLNTSFNRAGEPIVATPDDALSTALAAGLDLLVIEGALIELQGMARAGSATGRTGHADESVATR